MQKQSTLFDKAALKMRSANIVAAWDAGHITGSELRMLASLFFDEFADDYLADIHGCDVEEIGHLLTDDKIASPFVAIPVVRLATNMPLLLEHAEECRVFKREVDLDDISEDMFERQGQISKIIHAHSANAEINNNYPLYATRFYRLVQRVMSVLIIFGGDAQMFDDAIVLAQRRAREASPEPVTGTIAPIADDDDCPIYVPLFDIGELLLRNCDIIAAWDEGLMTWPELRMLSELFYAEDAAFVLAKAYRSDADEIHRLWNSEGLADPFMGVPLARLAAGIDVIIKLARDSSHIAHDHWLGKASGQKVDAFHIRALHEIEAIISQPLACDELYDDQKRYRASVDILYAPMWNRACKVGYDAQSFKSAIARVQRGEAC